MVVEVKVSVTGLKGKNVFQNKEQKVRNSAGEEEK